MTYFTDSPFERMMVQRPRSNPGALPVSRPRGKCRGCGYHTGKPCVGICLNNMDEMRIEKDTGRAE